MKVIIEIHCDNAAFEDNMVDEVQRILRSAGEKFADLVEDDEPNERPLRDSNGNRVGTIDVDPEREEDDEDDEVDG